jgi:NAD+ synthase (glutamine-hydrolysing)
VPQIKLALAQVNPTVGDLSGNRLLCLEAARQAASAGANLVAFPEMVITGYPVEDLALRPSFQTASERELELFAKDLFNQGLGNLVAVVGYLRGTSDGDSQELGVPRGAPMNCAAVIHGGKVLANYAKHHLPNYGVFDEYRYFVPGERTLVFRAFGTDIALAICEDLWQDGGPVAKLSNESIGLLIVLNGSPYEREKDDVRLELVKRRATQVGAPLAYVNMCGGQDELVFDGDSLIVDRDGAVIARSPQFHEDILVIDITLAGSQSHTELSTGEQVVIVKTEEPASHFAPTTPTQWERLDQLGEVYEALVTGLHDYVEKNGFSSVLIGLSGGIDSAFVAALACDALGPERVYGISMPSEYSSEHSQTDAADLAQRMGLHYRSVPIAPMVTSYLDSLNLTGLAEENLQARVRGTTLMGISNQEGHLVLATGNKSELAVGYSTIYGDAVGGYAPIKDVPKTDVWALSTWRNQQATDAGLTPPIPEASITKPPSA